MEEWVEPKFKSHLKKKTKKLHSLSENRFKVSPVFLKDLSCGIIGLRKVKPLNKKLASVALFSRNILLQVSAPVMFMSSSFNTVLRTLGTIRGNIRKYLNGTTNHNFYLSLSTKKRGEAYTRLKKTCSPTKTSQYNISHLHTCDLSIKIIESFPIFEI